MLDCPGCKDQKMKPIYTKEGVVIDKCSSCEGIWLDEGEIFFFSKQPKWLHKILNAGLMDLHPSDRDCPRCKARHKPVKLQEGGFAEKDLLIDECPQCKGLWFDKGELSDALRISKKKIKISPVFAAPDLSFLKEGEEPEGQEKASVTSAAALLALPNLAIRSTFCFILLYGMVFFMLIVAAELMHLPFYLPLVITTAFIFIQYLISPWLMDLVLGWLFKFKWVGPEGLPGHLRDFIRQVCTDKKMKYPKVGIIEDLNPNAFTYGRTPQDARIVITRGLLHYLDEEEVNAVVAHELGHAYHWDILVMTMASLVPIILYTIYRLCMEIAKSSKGGKNNPGPYFAVVGLGAFILYIIAEYIVLWLSRTREYWADRFAGEVTREPNALAAALVKIAYGLVDFDRKESLKEKKEGEEEKEKRSHLESINMLGIFDKNAAKSLALHTYSATKEKQKNASGKDTVVNAMKWDLWNPWATYYEIHSTHPLPAKRINALSNHSASLGKKPLVVFDKQKPESYWDEFIVDVFMVFLPLLPVLSLVGLLIWKKLYQVHSLSLSTIFAGFMIAYGFLYFFKTLYAYRGKIFPKLNVASLLGKVKVSHIRPVPVTLKGKIVGRGVPGYIFSEDMVIEDESGIIFLDYRQPLWIFDFLFALFKTGRYIGQEATVEGWYRRAPVPYVEVKKLKVGNNHHQCYTYHFKLIFGLLVFLGGIFWGMGPFIRNYNEYARQKQEARVMTETREKVAALVILLEREKGRGLQKALKDYRQFCNQALKDPSEISKKQLHQFLLEGYNRESSQRGYALAYWYWDQLKRTVKGDPRKFGLFSTFIDYDPPKYQFKFTVVNLITAGITLYPPLSYPEKKMVETLLKEAEEAPPTRRLAIYQSLEPVGYFLFVSGVKEALKKGARSPEPAVKKYCEETLDRQQRAFYQQATLTAKTNWAFRSASRAYREWYEAREKERKKENK